MQGAFSPHIRGHKMARRTSIQAKLGETHRERVLGGLVVLVEGEEDHPVVLVEGEEDNPVALEAVTILAGPVQLAKVGVVTVPVILEIK